MNVLTDIWQSFRRLPAAVQVWVALWLAPINIATLFFLGEDNGVLIAVLAIGGMAPNMLIMHRERGLSALMALPHLLIWPVLVIIVLITMLREGASGYGVFLAALLATDVVSLVFDARDFQQWRAGDRAIA